MLAYQMPGEMALRISAVLFPNSTREAQKRAVSAICSLPFQLLSVED